MCEIVGQPLVAQRSVSSKMQRSATKERVHTKEKRDIAHILGTQGAIDSQNVAAHFKIGQIQISQQYVLTTWRTNLYLSVCPSHRLKLH